jgi:uncharacterized protein (DUF2252 family)
LRNLKMARSAHAYVRGNTLKFYDWLSECDQSSIPEGPPIWICGDCHLGNLGPVADAKGRIEIEIRDLDQTVIGNPAHDLIRLALSMATAARGSDLPGVTTAHILEEMMAGYEDALKDPSTAAKKKDSTGQIQWVMKQALKRKWRHLAEERIQDVKPTIPLGARFWPLSKSEKNEITEIFKREDVRKLITSLHSRDDDTQIRVADAAYWVKGCSSLGRVRYAVLLQVGKHNFCLVDMKEAVKAAAPRSKKARMPAGDAERVVQGARALSPYLGERMLATKFLEHHVVARELMPQDLKFEMDQINQEEGRKAARYLASVVGKAHVRQMDSATSGRWRKELSRARTKKLDAPSWLWTTVVELISSHEMAYLEHCRKYALELNATAAS